MNFDVFVKDFYAGDDDKWEEHESDDENLTQILSVLQNWSAKEISWSVKENCPSIEEWSQQHKKGVPQGSITDLSCIPVPQEKKIELSFKFKNKVYKRAVKELSLRKLERLVASLIDEDVCWQFSLENDSNSIIQIIQS